jgi:hypothetical protein
MIIQLGLMAPNLKDQLAGFDLAPVDVARFQKDNEAITRLALRNLLPPAEVRKARARLAKQIRKAIGL